MCWCRLCLAVGSTGVAEEDEVGHFEFDWEVVGTLGDNVVVSCPASVGGEVGPHGSTSC